MKPLCGKCPLHARPVLKQTRSDIEAMLDRVEGNAHADALLSQAWVNLTDRQIESMEVHDSATAQLAEVVRALLDGAVPREPSTTDRKINESDGASDAQN